MTEERRGRQEVRLGQDQGYREAFSCREEGGGTEGITTILNRYGNEQALQDQ